MIGAPSRSIFTNLEPKPEIEEAPAPLQPFIRFTMAHAGPSQVPETVVAIESPPLPATIAPRSPSPSAPLLASRSPAPMSMSPSLAGSAVSAVDPSDELNTINIHIQINVPKSLALPCFRRSWYRERCRARCGHGTDASGRRRWRFLGFILTVFYISFIVCGAVAWHLRNDYDLYTLGSRAPLVLATFSPLLDAFVTVSSILVIRRHTDNDKPGARYAILFFLNFALFVLHVVILGIAGSYLNTSLYGWGQYQREEMRDTCAALVMYSTSTMILFKLLLAGAVIGKASLRRTFKNSVARIPLAIGEEYRYQTLTHDVDADARQIESARSSVDRDQRQIFLT
ncbi:hypothetical protein Dda_3365 [Drechslerella dactyloides]|uniref:Uncharacterized protein n=1 Tax=Drechslerella dactyloides TaxID=74499 RepID=A0AAD6NL61_DREDA|nr:hypothetical protein Dda_3365 [Drechslerella dactyloides]